MLRNLSRVKQVIASDRFQPLPRHAVPLTSAPQRMQPVSARLLVELIHSLFITRHIEVGKVAAHNLTKPFANHGDGLMATA